MRAGQNDVRFWTGSPAECADCLSFFGDKFIIEQQISNMQAIDAALQQAFQTIMTVADYGICLILSAVVLHYCALFFRSMVLKLPLRLFDIVLWGKLWIFSGLSPV